MLSVAVFLVGMICGALLVCFVITKELSKYKKYQPLSYSVLEKELNALDSWVRKHG